jgi:GAF domain-containing protein
VFITASVLFSVRSLAALTGINILIFFITNQIIPGLTTVQEFSIISISGSIAILNLFFSWYRNLVENQRISDIQATNVRLQDENKELGAKRSTLETLIEDRSKELNDANRQNEVRAAQFRAITEIARVINTRQNLQELLPKITNVISEQFGFYHVGIFLNDFSNQYAVLSAANSEGGKKMIERGHRLKVGDQGIIGYVTKAGVPRIALNTESDIIYFNNPDLPDTRSEIGLPLKSGDKVIGALDVQSTITDAFSGEDIDILTALSDQVSLSIENTRLFEQTQKALTEAEAISRQYLNQSWSTLKQEKSILGFRYSMGAVAPLDQEKENAKIQAEENKAYINVPIQLRGITIGSLRVAMPQDKRARQNEKDLINAVAERVALSVENARLFEETNKRAERERIIAGIADKIGASFRTESVLATTAQELSQFLEGAEILIQLGTTPTNQ